MELKLSNKTLVENLLQQFVSIKIDLDQFGHQRITTVFIGRFS